MKQFNYNPKKPIFAQLQEGDMLYKFSVSDVEDNIIGYEISNIKGDKITVRDPFDEIDGTLSCVDYDQCDTFVSYSNNGWGWATSREAAYDAIASCCRYHYSQGEKDIQRLEDDLAHARERNAWFKKMIEKLTERGECNG